MYWQSIAVHLYLFDAELEETILVFVADRVFFMGRCAIVLSQFHGAVMTLY